MSTTSTVDESAKPSPGKYSKRLTNLSKNEAQTVVRHFNQDADLTGASRVQLLILLFQAKPELKNFHQTLLLCFEVYQDHTQHRLRFINCDHNDEFPERPCSSTQVDMTKVLQHFDTENIGTVVKNDEEITNQTDADLIDKTEESLDAKNSDLNYYTPHHRTNFKLQKPEVKPFIDSNPVNQDKINSSIVDTLQTISNKLQNSTKSSKKPFVSKNLHYDDSEDISIFFNKISASAQGQGLKSDNDKINMAIQVLSASSTGSQLLGLCNDQDYEDWTRFCQKLLRMTGSSHKSYEQQFLSYERQPGQPSSLLMATLINLYKRSCQYSETQTLNKYEQRHIRMRFLLCLEPQLRSLLEDRLSGFKEEVDLEQLSQKCQELEVYYRLGSYKPKVVNAIKQETSPSEQQQLLKSLLEAVQNLTNGNQPKARRPPINDALLKGFCMRNVKGTCPFGDKCKYKHSKVPDDVLKHMQQRYNIKSKTA